MGVIEVRQRLGPGEQGVSLFDPAEEIEREEAFHQMPRCREVCLPEPIAAALELIGIRCATEGAQVIGLAGERFIEIAQGMQGFIRSVGDHVERGLTPQHSQLIKHGSVGLFGDDGRKRLREYELSPAGHCKQGGAIVIERGEIEFMYGSPRTGMLAQSNNLFAIFLYMRSSDGEHAQAAKPSSSGFS